MSNSSSNELLARLDGSLPEVGKSLLSPLRAVAFWTAIVLPFLYVPLLVSGLQSGSMRLAFVTLVVCNALALLFGHSYAEP